MSSVNRLEFFSLRRNRLILSSILEDIFSIGSVTRRNLEGSEMRLETEEI